MRPCQRGLSSPTIALTPMYISQMPPDPDDQRHGAEQDLGEQLVARAAREIDCSLRVARRVVDGAQQVGRGVAVGDDDHDRWRG